VDDRVNRSWLEDSLSAIDTLTSTRAARVAVNELGVMRWEPGAHAFMDDQMELLEERGSNHVLWLWETSSEEYAAEVDALNFRHGPDPQHHADVESSDLMDVIVEHWGRNTIRPSSGRAMSIYLPPVIRAGGALVESVSFGYTELAVPRGNSQRGEGDLLSHDRDCVPGGTKVGAVV
jgi:hypothetical protein